MNWEVKYRSEFNDNEGITWKIDVLEYLASAPTIITLKHTGEPLTFEYDSDSDEFNSIIKPSRAIFNVWSTVDFTLAGLYSNEDFYYKVNIYHGATLYWTGFIVTGEYMEPYEQTPYEVSIAATDGLNYLKNYLFKYKTTIEDDTYYNGRTRATKIILDILGKIQVVSFAEYLNIYEEQMDGDGVGDSPLEQVSIDVDVFKDMYCFQVLEELLKPFNACVIQSGGVIRIYRPTELISNPVYGRVYTGELTKTSTSYNPTQSILRAGVASDLSQLSGSMLMVKRPAKSVIINQDYGNKESWIENYQFKADSYIPSPTFKYRDWTYSGSGVVPLSNLIIGESDGIGFLSAPTSYTVSQSFGVNAKATSNKLVLEFDYMFYNPFGSSIFYNNITIKSDNSDHWLAETDANFADWVGTSDIILIVDTYPTGNTGWIHYKRIINGLPTDGSYTITIQNPYGDAGRVMAYKDIKFYSTADGLTINKRGVRSIWQRIQGGYGGEYQIRNKYYNIRYTEPVAVVLENKITKLNAIAGIEKNFDIRLGDAVISSFDNELEQCAGSLAVSYISGYTDAVDKVDTITVAPDGGGTANVQAGGITRTITWNTDEDTTITNFIATQGSYYTGLALAKTSSNTFTFTGSSDFADATVDEVWLTADQTTAYFIGNPVYSLVYSANWNTRGGSESKPILEIIADETADQYSRPKQLIQMEMYDSGAAPSFNIIGFIQDSINLFSAVARKFVFNRGSFSVKKRLWSADLIEII